MHHISSLRDDAYYLVGAYQNAGLVVIEDPQARTALCRLGYFAHTTFRTRLGWNSQYHVMVLTKKGQKRALEIVKQLDRDRKEYMRTHPRGPKRRNRLNCKNVQIKR